MNKNKKSITKKIIILILIVMLCNFVVPKQSLALNVVGGVFFKPIAQFIAKVADLVIQALQTVAIGDGTIQAGNSDFYIRFSPGVIFSGEIPMFDINFINPMPDYNIKVMIAENENLEFTYDELGVEKNYNTIGELTKLKDDGIIYHFLKTGELKNTQGTILKTVEPPLDYNSVINNKATSPFYYEEIVKYFGLQETDATWYANRYSSAPEQPYTIFDIKYKDTLYKEIEVKGYYYTYTVNETEIEDYGTYNIFVDFYELDLTPDNYNDNVLGETYLVNGKVAITVQSGKFSIVETDQTLTSIAKTLRGYVTTWYKVLREVALVGLLVVLVYVAIRMILCSTSKEKAKYKKMFVDWVVAICIVFTMQYVISIVFNVTGAITDFFAETVVGENSEDVLMSDIRNNIGRAPKDFMKVFAQIVMYVVLVIYTVLFTIQYLKRTIYMAFLTLISPLVAFTYPLDKLKDGKAQAFSAWLKEFIYTALVQPVHLIIYSMLVTTAIDFSKSIPIYAIIVIGFLLPAEKFVKEMLGLNKSKAVGNMAAAFGGAAVMNGINKLGSLGSKKKGSGEGSKKDNSKIRTVNNGNSNGGGSQGQTSGSQNNGNQGRANQNAGSQNGGNSSTASQSGSGSQTVSNQTNGKRNIKNKTSVAKGIGNVAKRYVFNKNTGKKLLRGTAKLAGAATLGTIGLAAGIATGDASKALGGALGGIAAGKNLGGRAVDGGANLLTGAKNGIRQIRDTYREGKYGQEDDEEEV